jgi:hypothetical protein
MLGRFQHAHIYTHTSSSCWTAALPGYLHSFLAHFSSHGHSSRQYARGGLHWECSCRCPVRHNNHSDIHFLQHLWEGSHDAQNNGRLLVVPFYPIDHRSCWPDVAFRVLDTLQLAFVTHAIYYYTVTSFNDPLALLYPTWSILGQIFVTCISDLMVRYIFGRRLWRCEMFRVRVQKTANVNYSKRK